VAVLARVAAGVAPDGARVEAIRDNLRAPRASDVLVCALAYPRWACVFPPTSAPARHLIEPWWQGRRSLARKGRRFETWGEVWQAGQEATAAGHAHRHPVSWGRRRRHDARRRPGLGRLPKMA
jgi:hypothetical protein